MIFILILIFKAFTKEKTENETEIEVDREKDVFGEQKEISKKNIRNENNLLFMEEIRERRKREKKEERREVI